VEFLLTDDNEITIEIEKLMLESCGLSVVTAGSGEEAVRLASEKEFFMIFMDIHMPEMNGFRAAELIRESSPNVPVIALSADEIAPDDPEYIKSGMNGSLLKPLQMDDLKELLNRFLVIDFAGENVESSDDSLFSYDELFAVMKDKKAVLRLLTQFLSVHSHDCEMLNEHVKNGEIISAREILHNVIGISGNMFCKRLYRVSGMLSDELKKGVSDSLDSFTEIWNDTFKELSDCRSRLSEEEDISSGSEDWQSLRESFVSLCEDFDVSAAELFVENMGVFAANMTSENFKQLKNAVSGYDFPWITDNLEVLYVQGSLG